MLEKRVDDFHQLFFYSVGVYLYIGLLKDPFFRG